jgi:hypothetical protein
MDQLALTFPHLFEPRVYQLPFLDAMDQGYKRAVCVWHRRSGKDKTFLNWVTKAMRVRRGAYYYYFPTAQMGRDILWDGMDRAGFKFMDHFPKECIRKKREDTMMIEMDNGSIFKIRGTDRNEPIGVNPMGVVFSEFSRQNPKAGWDLVRPILAENNGWAVFNYTPRGKNHAYRLFRMAQGNPRWFCQLLTVDKTNSIPLSAIQEDRDSGMSEEMIQQEYYCSFDVGQEGTYYGRIMQELWRDKQICDVAYDKEALVHTAWDLGKQDPTAIWFFQVIGEKVRIIDYYENHGEGMSHYIRHIKSLPYEYGYHYGPHDLGVVGTGTVIFDTASRLGIEFKKLKREKRVDDGIERVRGVLPRCWFDKTRCEHGINALEDYHSDYNEKNEVYAVNPAHTWSSHAADAFRYLSMVVHKQIYTSGTSVSKDQIKKWSDKYRRTG